MPDLFEHLLASVYTLLQQNECILKALSRGVVTLFKRTQRRGGGEIRNFRPITLLNRELKILGKFLAKWLARVVRELVGEAQTCA